MTAEITAADIRPSVWMMSLTLRCYYQRIHNYTTLLNSYVFQIEKLSRVLFHPIILKFEQFSHLLLTFFNTLLPIYLSSFTYFSTPNNNFIENEFIAVYF